MLSIAVAAVVCGRGGCCSSFSASSLCASSDSICTCSAYLSLLLLQLVAAVRLFFLTGCSVFCLFLHSFVRLSVRLCAVVAVVAAVIVVCCRCRHCRHCCCCCCCCCCCRYCCCCCCCCCCCQRCMLLLLLLLLIVDAVAVVVTAVVSVVCCCCCCR